MTITLPSSENLINCNLTCKLDLSEFNKPIPSVKITNPIPSIKKHKFLKITIPEGNKLIFKSVEYILTEINFLYGYLHKKTNSKQTTSDGTGVTDPMELILNFKTTDSLTKTKYLCISIFVKKGDVIGKENEFFYNILTQLTINEKIINIKTIKNNIITNFKPINMIPVNRSYYYYDSTKRPKEMNNLFVSAPNRIIKWIVFHDEIHISSVEFDILKQLLKKTDSIKISPIIFPENSIPDSLYFHNDVNYRKHLSADDIVVNCKREDGHCGSQSPNDIDEMNDSINKCPNTLVASEINSIQNALLKNITPSSGQFMLSIFNFVIMFVAMLLGLGIAKLLMKQYNRRIIFHLIEWVVNWFNKASKITDGLTDKLGGADFNLKIKEKRGNSCKGSAGNDIFGASTVADKGGGKLNTNIKFNNKIQDNHTLFTNYYNNLRH